MSNNVSKEPEGDLYLDAWGKPKVVNDTSLYHGMFTFEVPQEYWYETLNGAELTSFVNATSANGELNLVSNGVLNDKIGLRTFRNPRYQPNRGSLYSASIILPNPTAAGQRDFGTFTSEAGLFFRLRGNGSTYSLYIVSRTTINSVTTDTETDITTNLPAGFDPAMGNIYDLQAQMRMVGNFRAYVGNPQTGFSEQVGYVENLNMSSNLAIFNPAFPIAFECINQGDDVTICSGCVDLTSEGGGNGRGFYGSVGIDNAAGQVAISGLNIPILAVRNLPQTQSGFINTRDMVALLATAYSDQRSVFRVWATRDLTAITVNDQSWVPFRDGLIEYIQYDNPNVVTPMTFDTTKAELIFTARVDQDQSYATSALFEGRADIYQTPGDIFIFTMHRETAAGANVGVTYEFSEEV